MMDRDVTYGFVGLGHQGRPMVQRMIDEGLRPWLWARRQEVLDEYRDADAHIASTLADLGARCDVIGLCMLHADATDAVLWDEGGVMSTARPGTVLAIHGTVGAAYVEQLARRAAERGVRVVDAPVSGGHLALERQLLVMLGGDDDDCARCRPMLDTYAGHVVRLGAVGTAQSTKMVNNLLYLSMVGLLMEALELGDLLGIDADGLATVLSGGSAATLLFPSVIGMGVEDFSVRAWPTLHKDLDLVRPLVDGAGLADGNLLASAADAIERMAALRSAGTG